MTTAAASAGAPVNVPHIGFGHVWHTRLRPRRHRCIVPTFFLLVPMTYRLRHLLNPIATHAPAAGATSTPITTWAMRSTRYGWTGA